MTAIEARRAQHALVIGADMLSRFLDPEDRQSAMLFGDGAGAVVVTAADGPSHIGPIVLGTDTSGSGLIRLTREEAQVRMDGPEVYRRAVEMMSAATHQAVAGAGATLDDIDLFVYHQANSRIIRAVGARLGLDDDRVVDYVGRYANTSAASLPLALSTAQDERRLRPGDRVLLGAFGAGLVWGAAVLDWRRQAAAASA